MDLSNLKPAAGSKHSKKRVGRGPGTGQGTQAGRGHKGAKSRSIVDLGLTALMNMEHRGATGAEPDTGDGAATEIETADPTFQPISAGKLTVCSDVPYPPFEFQDDAGKWTGFDIDVISAVASRYGLAVEVTKQPFDSILVAVGAGTCDVVASAVTITDERKKVVNFTEPYFSSDQGILVKAGVKVDKESIKKLRLGVKQGTTILGYLADNVKPVEQPKVFAEAAAIVPFMSMAELRRRVEGGGDHRHHAAFLMAHLARLFTHRPGGAAKRPDNRAGRAGEHPTYSSN